MLVEEQLWFGIKDVLLTHKYYHREWGECI